MKLTEAPAALTKPERAIFLVVAAIAAASRLLAISRSIWDWDEALFCLGMRSYDVALHHPHPPGFPLYIVAAKAARLLTSSDFRALQALNVAAGMLLFPAMFLLARELRLKFTTSIIASSLLVFFPNVWFFGGTAFSDVVSITLVVFAAALLFRGCRDRKSYLIGALLLGVSIGIRPQNMLVGLFPAMLATWFRARQSVRDVLLAAAIGGAVVIGSYAGAIRATGGLEPYFSAVRAHSEYIARVDSFRSPSRPPLWRLFDRFFIKQYQQPGLSIATSLFVLISMFGAVRERNRWMLYNALTFAPFAISAWLMLDRYSISRFSIGYAPMFALFAADGIARLTRKPEFEAGLGAILTASFLGWTWPALTVVRNEVSPTILGVEAARQHLDPKRANLYVGFPMTPFVDLNLPEYPYHVVYDEHGLPLGIPRRPPYLLTEITRERPAGFDFRRERGHLWDITRRHYFEVALEPISALAEYGDGWYPAERKGTEEWRWMSGKSTTILPPAHGTAKLRIEFDVPDELMSSSPPTITLEINDAVIDRFRASESHLTREYDVTPDSSVNTLEILTDRTFNEERRYAGTDRRDLGLMIRYLSWGSEE